MALALNESARQSVAEHLQPVLTKLLDLNLSVKHAHWNVRGSGFRSLHLQLDELSSLLGEFTDVPPAWHSSQGLLIPRHRSTTL